ncbi:conjugal transfer protein TraG N-terminal domain-containing protein [uncultured Tateyamaria sp.]|uniref:conjugal transfer protein TraG N-terminal domain-containing protein n=1 Tax=uncultured Tateyamaria sp. TaxID=455651 RepID=UPI0026291B46|nr:conjugal transfer protein TraG N-terminal domain-containing protein [uncultured Tateyamaria sp.]
MLEIYTTGGGEFLTMTLNAVAAFFNTANAAALINIALLVGLIVLVFQVLLGGDLKQAVKAYVVIGLIGGLSVADKSDVIIFDKTKGPLWSSTVSGVPTSVAYVGSFTSRVSNVLTTQFEALYSPPTNLSYQRHGMLFGATLMTKSARWRAVTSAVHENLTNFFDQCVLDAVDLRYISPDLVTRSGNLEDMITANMPQSLAYYDVATRTTRTCADGWPDIVGQINAEVNVVLGAQAASTFQGSDPTLAVNDLRATISDFAAFAGYAATSAENHVKQSMLIAAFDDAAHRGITASGNAAALQHLQSARAELQTRSSYQAVGANALNWVPYLKIVFENLYYGAFPIALALMMTPFALTIARGYFGGFLWLASWEPLSAILHSIMMNASAERFQTITSASTSGAYTDSVMNWANHFGVYAIGQDVAAMAGYLMMSVPFVAAAIFLGTQRMVGLATSMLAVSQSAASETGREMTTGNFAYGNASVGNRNFHNVSRENYARNNVSYDNVSANRNVTSPFTDTGRSTYYSGDGSIITANADGSVGIDGGSSRVNTAANLSIGQSVVSSLRDTATNMRENGNNLRQSTERSVSELSSNTSSFMQSITTGEAWTTGAGVNTSAEERASLTESMDVVDRFAETHAISRQTAIQVGTYASAGIEWGFLSGGVRSSLEREGVTAERYEAITDASHRQGVDNAISNLAQASQSASHTESGSLNRTGDHGFRDTVDDLSRQSRTADNYFRAANSYSAAADQAHSDFYDSRLDVSGAFTGWMIDNKGMSATQVAELMNGRTDNPRLAELRGEFSARYVDEMVSPQIQGDISGDVWAPADPGYGSLPLPGSPYNHMMPEHTPLAERKLAAETEIMKQTVRMDDIEPGSAAIAGRVSDAAGRNAEANNNSWANSAGELIGKAPGGQLVPDGNRVEWRPSAANAPGPVSLDAGDRDLVIRTIAAESAGETRQGQVAVASVIRNRINDDRHPNDASGVVFAPKQFSAWNTDGTGNNIGFDLRTDSQLYRQIGDVVDDVFSGNAIDPTGGATHYYSPKGMQGYVDNGHQSNLVPPWQKETEAESGGSVTIGTQVFSGRTKDEH